MCVFNLLYKSKINEHAVKIKLGMTMENPRR